LSKGLFFVSFVLTLVALSGCADYNNRPPASAAETKAADDHRQAYVDTIPNLTPEQRNKMKSQLGGQAAPTPSTGTTRPDPSSPGR
jgi:hypothetical protein